MVTKSLTILVALVLILVALLLSGMAGTNVSVADTRAPDNEIANTTSEADQPNSSASATITITMYTSPDD